MTTLVLSILNGSSSFLHTLFQVQSYLPLSIVNYGVSKHYAGSMVSDRCPLGYLFQNPKTLSGTTVKNLCDLMGTKI